MLYPSTAKSKSDCPTHGFPIFYSMSHKVAENEDTATPLVPAAVAGVMGNLIIDNQSCNEIVASVEFWSANSDCDGCTEDVPLTAVQDIAIPPNTMWKSEGVGYFVDYEIDGGVFLADGCVVVSGSRQTSACCKWAGVTTATNGLTVPSI